MLSILVIRLLLLLFRFEYELSLAFVVSDTSSGLTTSSSLLWSSSPSPLSPPQSPPKLSSLALKLSNYGFNNESSAPVFDGKRILPVKIMLAGLKGRQNVPAVYAVLSSEYSNQKIRHHCGGDDDRWATACVHVGITTSIADTLNDHIEEHGVDKVRYIRALSFLEFNENAMESVASDWRKEVLLTTPETPTTTNASNGSGGKTNFDPIVAAMDADYLLNDDDDDDDDDYVDYNDSHFEIMAGAMSAARGVIDEPTNHTDDNDDIISPFDETIAATISAPRSTSSTTDRNNTKKIEFTKDNVDKILDKIRPYLNSDGGNVSVRKVEEETKNVYLALEGACGSCPSSTVTMKMGIERVLKENFVDLGEVIQVENGITDSGDPKSLSFQAVQKEIDRMKPAIIAMGGVVNIVDVDPIGVVKLSFRGANKIKEGLELVLLDIDFVKHIEFSTDDY